MSPELTTPDDERAVEHAALLEVFEEACDRFVGAASVVVVVLFEVAVSVPVVVVVCTARIKLDEADAAFDKASREQAAFPEFGGLGIVEAVEVLRVSGLSGDVDGFRSMLLHLEGEFVAGDASGEFGVVGSRGKVVVVVGGE